MGQIIEVPGHGQVEFPDGMSDDQIVAAIKANPAPVAASPAGGVVDAVNTGVNWAGTQFTKGIAGLADASKGVGLTNQAAAEWLGQKLGAQETGQAIGGVLKHVTPIPGSSLLPNTSDAIFKTGVAPEVNAGDNPALTIRPPLLGGGSINVGKMLDAGAQAIPAVMAGPAATGGALRQGITTAIPAFTGGMGSELGGQAAQGMDAGPLVEALMRFGGGTAGYMGGNRAISPITANLSPEQARMVEVVKARGDPLSVAQETGKLGGVESAVSRAAGGAGPFESLREQQAMGAQRAALGDIGAVGERTDPTTMARVYGEKSAEFNAAKNASGNVTLGRDFYKDLDSILGKYAESTPASSAVPSVGKRMGDFAQLPVKVGNSGMPELTGEQYQAFRKSINDAAQSTADQGAKNALKDMRGALDQAMESSLPADQAAAWRTVRSNWAGLKTLLKASAGGTVAGRAEGNLSPSALATALKQQQGPDRFATTTGGLNDIARSSAYLADTIPNSGTGQTVNMQQTLRSLMLPGAGGAAGALIGGPVGGVVGAAAPVVGANLLARLLTGQGGLGAGTLRNYLANQAKQTNQPAYTVGARLLGQHQGGR